MIARSVSIADLPSHESRFIGRAGPDLINRFRFLPHYIICRLGLVNDTAVLESGFEIESELRAIRGDATPASLQEEPTLHEKLDLLGDRAARCLLEHSLNQDHQNKK